MTAWLLHILIDMIGHIHNLTPFLYPMSKVTMPPLFGWENTSMIIANYSILFFILIVLPRLKKTKTLAK
jgi:uncharacterized membrane protein